MQLTIGPASAIPPAPSAAGPERPASAAPVARRHVDERGEGVISAAIAVLVMAFIGVGMWVAFHGTLNHATNTINTQVNHIGSTGNS